MNDLSVEPVQKESKRYLRSKTLTNLQECEENKKKSSKKFSMQMPTLYSNNSIKKYLGSYARPKSYSKKRILMTNTADLGNLLSRHVNGKGYK
jgi:hypothetical protein